LAHIHSQIEGHSPCRLKQTNGDREYYSVRAKPVNRRAARLRAVRWTRSGKTLPRAPPPALEMPRPELCHPCWRLPPRPPMVAHWIGDAFQPERCQQRDVRRPGERGMDENYARFSRLLIDRPHARVLRVVMNRPDKLNAVDGEMHRELSEIWRIIDADANVSAVLLTGAGK